MSIKEYFQEWIVHYARAKDVIARKITNIEKNKFRSDVFIEYKDKKHIYFVEPFLKNTSDVLEKIRKSKKEAGEDSRSTLIVVNTLENLNVIVSSFDKLAEFDPHFSIIFVNPFSGLDTKWMIFPSTHSIIGEKASLQRGLKSLFETVETTTEKEFEERLKKEK